MKKVGIIVVALIGILIIAALVAPSFIDWNRYKPEIAEAVKEATGRDLDIKGDISLSILPTPSVSVEDLRLSNIRGAKNPDMLQLKSARVDVGLMALISGNIQVSTVEFIEPVIHIERLESGKGNWEFKPRDDAAAAPATPPSGTKPAPKPATPSDRAGQGADEQPFALSLDRVLIKDGTVVYSDHATGESQRLENINGTFMAASLQGPFEADGDMVLRGQRFSYELSLSEIIKGRTAQLRLKVGFPPSDGFVQISGSLANVQQAPTLRGKVQVRADDLAALMAATGAGAPSDMLSQKFTLDTDVTADMKRIEANDLRLALGPSQARGNVAVTLADVTDVKAALAFGHVNLDAWMASVKKAADGGAKKTEVKKKDNGTGIVVSLTAGKQNSEKTDAFALPTDITATVNITADALTYNKQPIRQVKFVGGMKAGVLSISDASALLPGAGQFGATGTVRAVNGRPQLAGDIRLNVRDLRNMMKWLDVDATDVPQDRLRTLSISGNLAGRPDSVRMVGLKGRLDSVTFGGSLGADLGQTTVLKADLEVDRLDIDAYMPPPPTADRPTGRAAGKEAGKAAGGGKAPEFEGIEGLKDLDADVRLKAGELIYQGKSAQSVLLDMRLKNGDAAIKTASVGNIVGNSIAVKGGLKGLATKGLPEPDNLVVTSELKDPPALFQLAGQETPDLVRKLGAIGLNVTVNGNFSRPALQGTMRAAGATAAFNGTVDAFAAQPVVNMNLTLTHPNLNTLLRLIGSDYRPKGPGISQVRLAGTLAGTQDKMKITGLDIQTGGARITGTVDATMSGEKAVIAADLATNAIEVERFMPADDGGRAGRIEGFTGIELVQAGDGQAVGGRVHPRWSREPLDLAALDEMIVDATVRSEAVIYAGTRIDKVDAKVSLKDGAARIEKFDGSLGGGPVAMTAELISGAPHRLKANLSVEKGRFFAEFGKGRGSSRANGILDLLTDVSASGQSEADLVQALNGGGNLAVSRLDVKGEGSGGGLAALYKLVSMLNSIGGPLSGGKGLAEMSADFDIRRGVTNIKNGRLSAGPYKGTVGGVVDLPAWVMDIEGEAVRQDQSVGGQVLRGLEGLNLGGVRVSVPKNLPFRISGPVDEPNVNVQTGRRTQPSQPSQPADTAPQQQLAPSRQQQDQLPLEQQAPSEQQVPLEQQEPRTQEPQQQDQPQQRQQKRPSPEEQLKRIFGL